MDLNDKDEEFVKRYHSINPDQAAPAKVPILIEPDGTQLIESLVICEYLEQRYPQVPLLPADAVQAAKVRLFVDAFSAQLTPALFGLLRAADAEAVAAGKAKLESALKVGVVGRVGCFRCACKESPRHHDPPNLALH